jgi:SulP family sulfate permease
VQALMMPALTIAMLGAIESLLSAIVADGMTDSRHDSNQELIGQGIANIVAPFFGGISSTGAIARTAANIRSGGKTPVAGIVHALTLLAITLALAPLVKFIPLTALSAVLFVVAFRMGEWENFRELFRGPKSDFGVLVASFALTVVFDLTVAVGAGSAHGGRAFRAANGGDHAHPARHAGERHGDRRGFGSRQKCARRRVVYRIEGPFFFGAAEKLETALTRSNTVPRVVIFRMSHVPAMDATGLRALEIMVDKFHRQGVRILFSGLQPQPMEVLFKSGFVDRIGLHKICGNVDTALAQAAQILANEKDEK